MTRWTWTACFLIHALYAVAVATTGCLSECRLLNYDDARNIGNGGFASSSGGGNTAKSGKEKELLAKTSWTPQTGSNTKKKERNVCNELQVSCPPQILCIFSLNLCQLNIGFGLGFSAVALPQIKEEFSIELSTWSQGAFGKVTVGKNRL